MANSPLGGQACFGVKTALRNEPGLPQDPQGKGLGFLPLETEKSSGKGLQTPLPSGAGQVTKGRCVIDCGR